MSEDAKTLAGWALASVSAEAMREWVTVLRDDNQIHVDPAVAEAFGYGYRTVNPGPANLAYVLNMLMEADPNSYPVKISARFLDNVFSGESVDVAGTQNGDGAYQAELRHGVTGAVALDAVVIMKQIEP